MLQVLWAAVVGAAVVADPYAGAPAGAGWHTVDHFVVTQLLGRPRGPWVEQVLAAPPPQEPVKLLVRFNLLLRDGRVDAARETLDALAARRDALAQHEWSQLADELIDRKDDDLARHLLERVPTATPGWGYVLVNRWAGVRNAAILEAKWRPVDLWLIEREAAARAALVNRDTPPWQDHPADYWFACRVNLREQTGTMPQLLAEVERAVRASPGDVAVAIRYATLTPRVDPPADPAWLRDVVRLEGAYEALQLGEALQGAWPGEAAAWFEKSLATPLGAADRVALQRQLVMRQAMFSPEERDLERMLRVRTKLALAQAYAKSEQHAKAQPLVEELAKDPLAGYAAIAQTAGQVQAATGARVVEALVVADEQPRGDDPEYWRERAAYFEGRGELDRAEQAHRKAIELATIDAPRRGKDATFYRSMAVWGYARFLFAHQRQPDAEALLWREFEQADPAGEGAARMLDHLAFFHKSDHAVLRPDDPRLWRYLAARPAWTRNEEMMLMRFAEQTTGAARDALWAKAEGLVGEDATRALTVGWVMTRFDADRRAVPLLQLAMAKAADDEARQRAAFAAFEAALALRDVALIEAQWPAARRRLGPREVPAWLEKMVEAAEHAGDAAAAHRWRAARANLDRRFELETVPQPPSGSPLPPGEG